MQVNEQSMDELESATHAQAPAEVTRLLLEQLPRAGTS